MTIAKAYIETHYDQFLEELKEFLRIPSISTKKEHLDDIKRAANWLKDHCLALGMTHAEVIETTAHPLVYAEWLGAGPDKPTVLIYGHYDVQPADGIWITAAFEPVVRNGNLYARGATDDKGQLFIHLKVFEAFMKTEGAFPINVKFLFEGDEEMGSEAVGPYVREHPDKLKADVVVISDTGMPDPNTPEIVYGLRGLLYTELEVWGPQTDLHSGTYGGTVHNPVQALAELIASMHDAEGHVTVAGFYDDVRELDDTERAMAAEQVPGFEKQWHAVTKAPQMWGEPEFNAVERIGSRPTLELNGIYGGFTEKGGQKTIIPASAFAKISCRLVPDQDPHKILELLRQHITKHAPPTIRWELRTLSTGRPVVVDYQAPAMQVAVQAYEQVFGKAPIFTREGGSIGVVVNFKETLNAPVVMMGFGLPDDNLHAPNEKFTLEMFHKGMLTALAYYEALGNAQLR
jgi:acetylornithine deacetylase/succinyl-diaminopimelate desuccinylase-like protein